MTALGAFVFAVAFACVGAASGEDVRYQYPSTLMTKTVDFKVEPNGVHMVWLRAQKVDGRYFPDGVENMGSLVGLHLRDRDGKDVVMTYSGGCTHYKSRGLTFYVSRDGHGERKVDSVDVLFGKFPDVELGDVMLGYLLYENGDERWVSQEIAIQCGGKGSHAKCTKCFKLIPMLVARQALGLRGPSPAGGRPQGVPGAGAAARAAGGDVGGADAGAAVFLDESVLKGKSIRLAARTLIYDLSALPEEKGMGWLNAGMEVRVVGKASPMLAHVRFTTSAGKTYDGAVRVGDLVPVFPLEVVTIPPIMNQEHEDCLMISHISFDRVAEGTAGETLRLCSVRQDGTSAMDVLGASGIVYSTRDATGYKGMHVGLRMEGARPGDEYLCFFLHDDGDGLWVSQVFGLRAGSGKYHEACASCFQMMDKSALDALQAALVARAKAGGAAKSGAGRDAADAGGFLFGEMELKATTVVYALAELPAAQSIGRLPGGTTVYVLDDVGGGFVKVRFTAPNGRSYDGAMKIADLTGP